jgi:hypothetical protein
MPDNATTCTACDGKGWSGPVHVNMGSGKHEWRERMDCFTCNGTGRISAEQVEAMRIGRKHRDARFDRDESMGEVARRHGISAAAVSAFEHGHIHSSSYEAGRAALARARE